MSPTFKHFIGISIVKIVSKLLAAAAAFALAGSAQAANLIVNGNFDSPDVGGGSGTFNSIPGWVSNTGDTIEIGNSGVYGLGCVTAGCHNLEVNANTFGDVSQTVSGLTAGNSYFLSLIYGGRGGGGFQQLWVSFGGQTIGIFGSDGSASAWTYYATFEVAATSASEVLDFYSANVGGNPSYGNEVTGVSLTSSAPVSSAPEPATWAMMLIGLGGIGGAVRSRRKAVTA